MKCKSETFPKILADRVVAVYPRKGIVCIDGFKYYNLSELSRAQRARCIRVYAKSKGEA